MHPGIFGGRALWADSGPSRMNTIASRDQFKPIRIGENLVVKYIIETRVEVWETEKCCGNTSRIFRVLPDFRESFYLTIRLRARVFYLTIGSCFSVHYRVMEHAGSLESTKEA